MEWSADITKRRAAHVVTRLGDLLQRPDFAHKTLFISGEQPKEAGGIKALVSRMGLEGAEILWVEEKKIWKGPFSPGSASSLGRSRHLSGSEP